MKQELVFEAPRRGLPPRHFADLDAAERVAAVAESRAAGVSGPNNLPASTTVGCWPTRSR